MYDEMKAIADRAGWNEDTLLRLVCQQIEGLPEIRPAMVQAIADIAYAEAG